MPTLSSSPEATPRLRRELVLFFRSALGAVLTAVVFLIAFLVCAEPAAAHWRAAGSGSTTASVATLLPPTNVVVPANSDSNVSVSWTGSPGKVVPTGYYIIRITGSTAVPACGSSMSTPIATTSCTDTSVPEGAHRYQVTAVHRSWTATSPVSGNASVSSRRDLTFTSQPSVTETAGSSIDSFQVQLRTVLGFPVLDGGVPITISIGANPSGGTLSGTLTAYTNWSGTATFNGLSINKAGVGYTLIASSPGFAGIVSSSFTVVPGAASKLVVTDGAVLSGSASTAAVLGPVTIQRQDAYGNAVTAGITTVSLASSSTGTAAFAATANGAKVATVTIAQGVSSASFYYGDTKTGTAAITAAAPGLTAPAPVTATITAAAPSTLHFSDIGPSVKRGVVVTPTVTVTVLDAFGNRAEAAQVTLQSACNLKGTLSQSATTGVASFPDLSIVGSGNAQSCTLTATSGALAPATSRSFTLT